MNQSINYKESCTQLMFNISFSVKLVCVIVLRMFLITYRKYF